MAAHHSANSRSWQKVFEKVKKKEKLRAGIILLPLM